MSHPICGTLKHWKQLLKDLKGKNVPRKVNEYLRVTEVIGFVNSEWFKWWVKSTGSYDECERIGKESAAFGTGVHKIVETYLLEQSLTEITTERQQFCGNLMVQWIKQAKAKVIQLGGKPAVECDLVSEKYKLKGHPDAVVTFNETGVPWLLDWKTSKSMKPDYKLQLAAYAMMIEEMYGLKVDDAAIIRTPNDPNIMPQFEAIEVHQLKEKYLPVFLSALDVCQFFKNKGPYKKVKEI